MRTTHGRCAQRARLRELCQSRKSQQTVVNKALIPAHPRAHHTAPDQTASSLASSLTEQPSHSLSLPLQACQKRTPRQTHLRTTMSPRRPCTPGHLIKQQRRRSYPQAEASVEPIGLVQHHRRWACLAALTRRPKLSMCRVCSNVAMLIHRTQRANLSD